ncbi:hypothetical protein HDU84_006369 [Entophlyctis sp. JEL0112]|nr:hypothetical protein HDU84_006369 [Entophlyctis sp. JEL0112]
MTAMTAAAAGEADTATPADTDSDSHAEAADADALVNPGPGIAPVFRVSSTISQLAAAVEHDRARIVRLADRIHHLALVVNSLAHAGAFAQPADSPKPGPSDDRLPRRSSRLLDSALALVSRSASPVPPPARTYSLPSPLQTSVSPQSDASFSAQGRSDSPPPPSPSQMSPRPLSRAWKAVSRLSLLAINNNLASQQATAKIPGTLPLVNRSTPPDHLRPETLLPLLERIKGFLKNTRTNDLLRICGTRRRFEARLKAFQGLVRTWTEEIGDGVRILSYFENLTLKISHMVMFQIASPEKWDMDDINDLVSDVEKLKLVLATQTAKTMGTRLLYRSSNSIGDIDSNRVDDDDDDDDDGVPFDLIAHLHISPGHLSAAREFAERRLARLVHVMHESTQLQAIFGGIASASGDENAVFEQHYSIDMHLEVKWLELVVKALSSRCPVKLDLNSSLNPYDLDDEGDGAPLGPVGIAASMLGSLTVVNPINGEQEQEVVIKRFRKGRQRDFGNLLIEKSATWISFSNDSRILSIIGTCFEAVPQLIVTPYLKNGNIAMYSKLHPGHSLRILFETASTMSVLHGMGVLHGGLRASNVLVNDQGKVVVADVGLWDYRVEAATDGVARNGWKRWAAPEVLRGGKLRPHSDVYSFAMTMYEILTGHVPFNNTLKDPDDPDSGFDPDNEESDIARLVLFDSIRPYRPSHCPDKLWTLIESCWAQEPAQRPTFSTVEAQLQSLLKLQSAFRRQSQIKSRAEAFLVEVPLNDLMPLALTVTTPTGADRTSSTLSTGVSAPIEKPEINSPGPEKKISVNLSFNLDSNIALSTIPVLPLGIDLPPTRPKDSVPDEDAELLEIDRDESSEFDESVLAFWEALVNTDDHSLSVPWNHFVESLQNQYPTLVGSLPSLKAAFDPDDTKTAVFENFKKYVMSQVPETAIGDSDSLFSFELIFGQFCAAVDADKNPQSVGPIDVTKISDMLFALTDGLVSNVREPFICAIAGVANGAGLGILQMLGDARVRILAVDEDATLAQIANSLPDEKGLYALHTAAKATGGAARVMALLLECGCAVDVRSRKGKWTALHVAAWSGATETVRVLLDFLSVSAVTMAASVAGTAPRDLVRAVDDEGWTCLAHAARYGHLEVVRVIVEFLQREYANDSDVLVEVCLPALQLARKHGWEEVARYLEGQL